MSRLLFTPYDHVLDSGTPLWQPRGDPTDNDRRLWEALETLTERQKQIVEMRHYEELSFGQIAKRLEISRQGAHGIYSAAISKLRKEMT